MLFCKKLRKVACICETLFVDLHLFDRRLLNSSNVVGSDMPNEVLTTLDSFELDFCVVLLWVICVVNH